jgi:hypothetical protein
MARACSSESRIASPLATTVRGSAINAISGIISPAGQSRATKRSRATPGSGLSRMSLITSSMFATAIAKPTVSWPRLRAFARRNFVRR